MTRTREETTENLREERIKTKETKKETTMTGEKMTTKRTKKMSLMKETR